MIQKTKKQKIVDVAILRYKVRGAWTTIRIENASFEFVEWVNQQEVIKDIKMAVVKKKK